MVGFATIFKWFVTIRIFISMPYFTQIGILVDKTIPLVLGLLQVPLEPTEDYWGSELGALVLRIELRILRCIVSIQCRVPP